MTALACLVAPARAARARSLHAPLVARGGAEACSAAELQEALDLRGEACLLACGAEWCGPCKALKPILASAAEASKGALTLKNIDVDKERAIAEALEATQLPTVYALRDGKLRDVLVGLPRTREDLAAFVMRAMDDNGEATGGAAVPGSRTTALARVAGRAALGAGGREKLVAALRAALDKAREAAATDRAAVVDALKTASAYLARGYAGRPVFKDNAVFKDKVLPVAGAVELFEAAGYVSIPADPDGDGDAARDQLHPTHRNLAVFELCVAEIDKARESLPAA